LAEGLSKLLVGSYCEFGGNYPKEQGNYVISYSGMPLYIGEARKLDERLKGHYRGSTFYKNYKEKSSMLNLPSELSMDDFSHQCLLTPIARKEIEEFGIVNLPAPLNKFQKGKRERFSPGPSTRSWDNTQKRADELLEQGEREVLSQKPLPWNQVRMRSVPGIYLIFNQDELIYIGESTDLAERYETHSSRTRFSAFRRQVATEILSFKLKTKKELGYASTDSKRNFVAESEDNEINRYINKCRVIAIPVYFGRLELEEHLIKNNRPLLNRKGNR
jgi:predicted GIY-YIG superfamily endonuclease